MKGLPELRHPLTVTTGISEQMALCGGEKETKNYTVFQIKDWKIKYFLWSIGCRIKICGFKGRKWTQKCVTGIKRVLKSIKRYIHASNTEFKACSQYLCIYTWWTDSSLMKQTTQTTQMKQTTQPLRVQYFPADLQTCSECTSNLQRLCEFALIPRNMQIKIHCTKAERASAVQFTHPRNESSETNRKPQVYRTHQTVCDAKCRGGKWQSTNPLILCLCRFFMYLYFTWVFIFLTVFYFSSLHFNTNI